MWDRTSTAETAQAEYMATALQEVAVVRLLNVKPHVSGFDSFLKSQCLHSIKAGIEGEHA